MNIKYIFILILFKMTLQVSAQKNVSKIITYPTPENNINIEGKTLVFNDEFEGPNVNFENWTCFIGIINSWEPEALAYYTDSPRNLYINDGQLVIATQNDTLGDKNYSAVWMWTQPIEYGYFEVKCRVPKGNCMWPAFWLTMPFGPGNGTYQEIDVFEFDTQNTKKFQTNVWHGTVEERHQFNQWIKPKQEGGFLGFGIPLDLGEESFIYAVDWSPFEVKFYINNTLVRTIHENIPYNPLAIHLSTGLGGGFVDADCAELVKDVEFPKYLIYDYIRIYKNDGQAIKIKSPDLLCGVSIIEVENYIQAQYEWEVADGLILLSGQGTNKIEVLPYENGLSNISVTVNFPDGSVESKSTSVLSTIDAPTKPSSISFSKFGSTCTYKADILDVSGANFYEWSFDNFENQIITTKSELLEIFPGEINLQVRARNCIGGSPVQSVNTTLDKIGGNCLWKSNIDSLINENNNIYFYDNALLINTSIDLQNSNSTLSVFDIWGRKVYSENCNNYKVDLNYLSNGLYIYEFKTNTLRITGKILIKK